jgi:multicomponent Na+:H+ antiporter subunit C
MNPALWYALAGIALFSISLYAMIVHEHLLRKILALNLMGSGVFLVLVAMARRHSPGPPDPVPHALVLTGIVVAVSATALALALACRVHAETGQARLPEKDSP